MSKEYIQLDLVIVYFNIENFSNESSCYIIGQNLLFAWVCIVNLPSSQKQKQKKYILSYDVLNVFQDCLPKLFRLNNLPLKRKRTGDNAYFRKNTNLNSFKVQLKYKIIINNNNNNGKKAPEQRRQRKRNEIKWKKNWLQFILNMMTVFQLILDYDQQWWLQLRIIIIFFSFHISFSFSIPCVDRPTTTTKNAKSFYDESTVDYNKW